MFWHFWVFRKSGNICRLPNPYHTQWDSEFYENSNMSKNSMKTHTFCYPRLNNIKKLNENTGVSQPHVEIEDPCRSSKPLGLVQLQTHSDFHSKFSSSRSSSSSCNWFLFKFELKMKGNHPGAAQDGIQLISIQIPIENEGRVAQDIIWLICLQNSIENEGTLFWDSPRQISSFSSSPSSPTPSPTLGCRRMISFHFQLKS